MSWKETASDALSWALAGLLLFLTLGVAVGAADTSFAAVAVGVCSAALFAPPVRRWIASSTNLHIGPGALLLVGVLSILAQAMLQGSHEDSVRQVKAEEEAKQAEQARQVKLSALLDEFRANKQAITDEAAAKAKAGKFDEAHAVLSKYPSASNEPEYINARRLIGYLAAKAELKNESKLPLERKVELYRTLVDYDKADTASAARYNSLKGSLELKHALEQKMAERKAHIEKQFSRWDGSHINVARAVKERLKNPDSYQHVRTVYRDLGDHILVTTNVRGTNSFNAIVPSTFVAEVDYNGNVLSVREVSE